MLSSNLKNYNLKYPFVGSTFKLDVHLSHLAYSSKALCHYSNIIVLVEKFYSLKTTSQMQNLCPPHPPPHTHISMIGNKHSPTVLTTNNPKYIYELCFPAFCMCISDLLFVGPKRFCETPCYS